MTWVIFEMNSGIYYVAYFTLHWHWFFIFSLSPSLVWNESSVAVYVFNWFKLGNAGTHILRKRNFTTLRWYYYWVCREVRATKGGGRKNESLEFTVASSSSENGDLSRNERSHICTCFVVCLGASKGIPNMWKCFEVFAPLQSSLLGTRRVLVSMRSI